MPEPTSPTRDRFGLAALALVGAAGALLNIGIVRELAQAAGYGEAASWLYWLVLDFFAVIAMRGAFKARTEKVRRWAGGSSVFALVLSAAAAGLHVFVIDGQLPPHYAFGVLCLPAVMIGLSLHLVLLMALEGRQAYFDDRHADAAATSTVEQAVEMADGTSEEVVETVTHQRQVTSRRTGKTAAFRERLVAAGIRPDDPRPDREIAAELNQGIGLHDTNARKLVAQQRAKELT